MGDFFKINIDLFHFSDILILIVIGVLLFTILYVFKIYMLPSIYKSYIRQSQAKIVFPLIETIIWMLFGIYVIYKVIAPIPLLGSILVLIMAFFAKNQLANLINGLFIRFKGYLKIGQQIILEESKGEIAEVNNFDIVIEDDSGTFKHITYTQLQEKEFTLKELNDNFYSSKFSITSAKKVGERELINHIQLTPWSFEAHIPKIDIQESKNEYQYNFTVYTIDRDHFDYLKVDLRFFLS